MDLLLQLDDAVDAVLTTFAKNGQLHAETDRVQDLRKKVCVLAGTSYPGPYFDTIEAAKALARAVPALPEEARDLLLPLLYRTNHATLVHHLCNADEELSGLICLDFRHLRHNANQFLIDAYVQLRGFIFAQLYKPTDDDDETQENGDDDNYVWALGIAFPEENGITDQNTFDMYQQELNILSEKMNALEPRDIKTFISRDELKQSWSQAIALDTCILTALPASVRRKLMPHSSIVSKALTLARISPPQTTTTSTNGHTTDHTPPKIRGIHAGTQTDQPKPTCDIAIQHNSHPVAPFNEPPPTRRPPDQTASSLMRVYAELEPRPVRTAPRAPIPAAVIAALTSSTVAVPARRRRAIPYTLQENGYPTAHLRPRTHSPPAAPAPVPVATPATQPATRPRMSTQTSPPPTPSPTSSSPGVTVPARRKRVPWTSEEECALEDGVREFGTDWDQIAREYSPIFITNARTPEDIKNKAQATLKKRKRSYNDRSLSPFHILDA